MLTRQQIKSCITKVGRVTTYTMFFEIIKDEEENECFFNIVSLTEEEIKELVPVKIISKRKVKRFFSDIYQINDMGKYRDEKEIIDFYFPTIMYEHFSIKQKFFIFAECYDFLVNKKLLKPIPTIKVNI